MTLEIDDIDHLSNPSFESISGVGTKVSLHLATLLLKKVTLFWFAIR